MKKMLCFMSMILAVLFVGCGGKEEGGASKTKVYEYALVTDVGTIDDKSFNQGAWEGLQAYTKEKNLPAKYYKPIEKSDEAYMTSMRLAIKGGAKVVVCPGFLFENPVWNLQQEYPDVKFIILDGAPHSGNYKYDIKDNTVAVFYADQQAGFLAGYAAVKDGYRNLGFMGGIAVPPVVNFGYGYVQGADYAAKELGIDDVKIKYTYLGSFGPSPENMAKAASWYNGDTDVIFACAGGAGNSVMKAAETAGKAMIGVDVDQSSESESVITSSMKNLGKSVQDILNLYEKGEFPGGKMLRLGAESGNVGLPMETSRFNKFTKEDYDMIYNKIANNEIEIQTNLIPEVTGLKVDKVQVELVK